MESESRIEHALGTVLLRATTASDVGQTRSLNEDTVLDAPPVFAVLDGMGGHADGNAASSAAAAELGRRLDGTAPASIDAVLAAIDAANAAVPAVYDDAGRRRVSGTTLAGLALVESGRDGVGWLVFNVGDSRVYRIAPDGQLIQLTVDHSVIQELLSSGEITPEQAATHPERNVITRALGAGVVVDPDVWLMPAEPGDAFLVCSDGLTRDLSDDQLADLIREARWSGTPVASALVEAANRAGGRDNISAIVRDFASSGVLSIRAPKRRCGRSSERGSGVSPRRSFTRRRRRGAEHARRSRGAACGAVRARPCASCSPTRPHAPPPRGARAASVSIARRIG